MRRSSAASPEWTSLHWIMKAFPKSLYPTRENFEECIFSLGLHTRIDQLVEKTSDLR